MSTRILRLSPLDAWFFRDGRPYTQDDADQTDVRTLFPPFAPTVVGAIRAALALGQGWDGRNAWPKTLNGVLGDGFDGLGRLRFRGPFLVSEDQWLFPAPLHLLVSGIRGDDGQSLLHASALLAPADGGEFECDLGRVRFPVPVRFDGPSGAFSESAGLWITADGYESVLHGQSPGAGAIVDCGQLWTMERRVGLARDHQRRAADEGMLYSPQYVRLRPRVELAVAVNGIPDDWRLDELVALGGESRMAYCERQPGDLPLPRPPVDLIRESGRFTVSLLTPMWSAVDSLPRCSPPLPGEPFPNLEGATVVSGCVGRAVLIGGWSSLKRGPLPLTPCLPAGSTWFCEAPPAAIDGLLQWHGGHVGGRTHYGFGQIVLGTWPREMGDTK